MPFNTQGVSKREQAFAKLQSSFMCLKQWWYGHSSLWPLLWSGVISTFKHGCCLVFIHIYEKHVACQNVSGWPKRLLRFSHKLNNIFDQPSSSTLKQSWKWQFPPNRPAARFFFLSPILLLLQLWFLVVLCFINHPTKRLRECSKGVWRLPVRDFWFSWIIFYQVHCCCCC